jgi:hypothetical protein
VHLLSALIAIAAAWRVQVFAREVLTARDPDRFWPWLVATLWFIGPLLLLHSMYALETGLYTLMVVTSVWYFGRLTSRPSGIDLRRQVLLGSLFGLTFLARNDAAFLVFALLSVRFVHGWASGRAGFRAAFLGGPARPAADPGRAPARAFPGGRLGRGEPRARHLGRRAVQTGTLGYWHDRTINLDRKVNPHALRARIDEGNVLAYVVDGPIACLTDWSGILSWTRREAGGFSDVFAPVVNDPVRNLGVLCRRGMEIGARPDPVK